MGNYADKTKLQNIQHIPTKTQWKRLEEPKRQQLFVAFWDAQKEIAPRDGALGECPIFAELWRRCFLSDPCRCPVRFPSMDPSWPFSQGQWCWLMWTLGRGFTGWWLTYPSEKYESIMKVNGKDDIPYYIMENDPNVWNHQPVYVGKWKLLMSWILLLSSLGQDRTTH